MAASGGCCRKALLWIAGGISEPDVGDWQGHGGKISGWRRRQDGRAPRTDNFGSRWPFSSFQRYATWDHDMETTRVPGLDFRSASRKLYSRGNLLPDIRAVNAQQDIPSGAGCGKGRRDASSTWSRNRMSQGLSAEHGSSSAARRLRATGSPRTPLSPGAPCRP